MRTYQIIEDEKVLGPKHQDMLASMNYLSETLRSQSKYETAEKMQHRVLKLYEKVLGPEHPDTLASMRNLCPSTQRSGQVRGS